MRILIISTFFPPLNSIASLRPYSWAKFWTQSGHSVTVLTTQKELRGQSKVDKPFHKSNADGSSTASHQNGLLHLPNPGYQLLEIPLPKMMRAIQEKLSGASPSFLRKPWDKLCAGKGIFRGCRMPDLTDFWISPALKAIRSEEPWDLVISTAGPYAPHLIAYRLKKEKHTKLWVADYRDSWSNNDIYSGLFPFNLIEKRLEKRILKQADLITAISSPFAKDLKETFDLGKVSVVENGLDPDELSKICKAPIFIPDEKFRIVHTGSVYKGKRDPTPLFRAIKALAQDAKKRPLLDKLEVIFAGPHLDPIQKEAEEMEVAPWIKCIGFVSREDALRMQRDAHALLFLPWEDTRKNGVLTEKIFEYLFSGTPIICIGGKRLEASQLLVLEAKAGQSFLNEEEIQQYLAENLANVQKIPSTPNFACLQRYTQESLAQQLLKLIEHHVA